MSKINQNITPKTFISQIEFEYNLKNITVNNLPVWQFLRNLIYSKMLDGKPPQKRNLKSLFHFKKRSNHNKDKIEYVLFTDTNELIKIENNQHIDKISQNIINALNEQLLIVINPPNDINLKIENNQNIMSSSYFHLKRRTSIINKKYKIDNELELKSICKKIDFDYYRYIKLFFTYHNIFNNWLDTINPKAVFVNCGYSLFHQALIYTCNIKNIKTLELQHGLISDGHIQYSPTKDIGKHTFPKYLLTFSDYYSQFINKHFIESSNLYPIGHYYRELKIKGENLECVELVRELRKKYKKIILVSSQDIIEKELINSLNVIAKARPEYCFIFKPRKASTLCFNHQNILVDEKHSVYDFINLIDVNLSCFSTNILESLSNRTIGILMDFSNLASEYYSEIKKDCDTIFICKNNDEAITILDQKIDNYNPPLFYNNNNKQNIEKILKHLS